MSALSLTDFLLARIADRDLFWEVAGESGQAHPDRVKVYRAECEAMRRIVEIAWEVDDVVEDEFGPNPNRTREVREAANAQPETLRALALPYADHPDYREEWRP